MPIELSRRAAAGFTLLWLSTEALGYTGALLIGYTVLSWYTNTPWPLIEKYADPASSMLTIVATGLTASSVYYPAASAGAPWSHSKYVALLVLVAVGIASVLFVRYGDVPHVAVNGFALLGIAGGLKRVIPRSVPGIPTG